MSNPVSRIVCAQFGCALQPGQANTLPTGPPVDALGLTGLMATRLPSVDTRAMQTGPGGFRCASCRRLCAQ